MTINKIENVCVIGAGTMGLQIALVAAVHGFNVNLYDASSEALKKAPERQRMMLLTMQFGQADIPGFNPDTVFSRISFTDDPVQAAKDADITSESVPERIELKKQIHSQFEKLVPAHCILTTNTSTLLVSDIETALTRPENFCAMHFHSGLTPLVDIMRGKHTSDATVNTVHGFVKKIGGVPMVMLKEKGGYLHNSILVAQISAALSLAAEGYGTFQDIDRAWMLVTGQKHGPFAVVDSVGINVVYDMGQNPDTLGASDQEKIMDMLKPYIDRGDLGVKTGKGFYSYPDPEFMRPGFLKGE